MLRSCSSCGIGIAGNDEVHSIEVEDIIHYAPLVISRLKYVTSYYSNNPKESYDDCSICCLPLPIGREQSTI